MPQYQGVWTLEAQAQAQSNQQWVTDPNFKNTTLLLQADGTGSGSQNNTFLDGSTNNFFITRNGNTTQGSFSPFSQAPGFWSNYLTSAGLSVPYAAALQLENTNWTIEAYFNLSSASAEFCVMGASNGGGGVPKYFMGGNWSTAFGYNANRATFFTYTGGNRFIDVPFTWEIGRWYHMAAVYTHSNTTITLYINGVSVGSMVYGIGNVTGNVLIGRNGENGGPINGYISNFRYIVGTSLYTANFTPQTTPLTAITNTQILTCQSNSFIDNSGNSRAVSVAAGTPSVQAFGPFAPALQWTPDVVGGSGYFDGSGDYLTAPNNAVFNLGSNDFTIECWVYQTVSTSSGSFISQWQSANDANSSWQLMQADGSTLTPTFTFNVTSPVTITSNTATKLNTWFHIAAVRNGLTVTLYLNGVSVGSSAISGSIRSVTNPVGIGTRGGSAGNLNFGGGYIAGARVVNGTAVYTAAFTPPTVPPTAVTNTQLLLNYTNAGIYDGAMDNVLETVGSAQVATSPVKYGSGSMYFSGVSPYSYLKGNANLSLNVAFGTGDFTVECWVWLTATASDSVIMDTRPGSNSANYFLFYLWTNGGAQQPTIAWYAPTSYIVSTGTVSAGAWTHIAICRANGILRSFKDGILQQAAADTTAYANPGAPYPYIGASYNVGTDSFKGYIDDFRISRVARYIANFTPPQQALPRQ